MVCGYEGISRVSCGYEGIPGYRPVSPGFEAGEVQKLAKAAMLNSEIDNNNKKIIWFKYTNFILLPKISSSNIGQRCRKATNLN